MSAMKITTLAAILILAPPALAAAGWQEGIAAFQAGDLEGAERELRAVVAQQPDWADGHTWLGRVLIKRGQTGDGLAHLERALALDGEALDTALLLAQTQLQLKRYEAAAAVLAEREGAGHPAAQQRLLYHSRAVAALKLERPADALPDLEKLVRVAPDDGTARYLLGTTAAALGRDAQGIPHLERAAALQPTHTQTLTALTNALWRRAEAAPDASKAVPCGKAADAAGRLLALDDSAENRLLRGEAELCAGRYPAAHASLRAAAAKQPGAWRPAYYAGRAAIHLERWPDAETSLKQALANADEPGQIQRTWQQLGYVHERQSRYQQAIDAYTRAEDAEGVARARHNQREDEKQKEIDKLQADADKVRQQLDALDKSDGR